MIEQPQATSQLLAVAARPIDTTTGEAVCDVISESLGKQGYFPMSITESKPFNFSFFAVADAIIVIAHQVVNLLMSAPPFIMICPDPLFTAPVPEVATRLISTRAAAVRPPPSSPPAAS